MADRSLDVDGTNASALTYATPLPGRIFPASVSLAEGSREGIPVGNTAQLGVSPSSGVATNGSTSTSTKHSLGHPGVGQEQLVAAQNSSLAMMPEMQQSPETNIPQGSCGMPGTVGQSTASTPTVSSASQVDRLVQFAVASPLFTATGPQSTHGSSVAAGSPAIHPIAAGGALTSDKAGSAEMRQRGSWVCPRLRL